MQQTRYKAEVKAYRIVKKHISRIMDNVPFELVNENTYQYVITSNIKKDAIYAMYLELYTAVGLPEYNQTERFLKTIKSFSINQFNEIINLWLNQNAGQRIVSVQKTLIDTVLSVIANGYKENDSIAEIAKILQDTFGWYRYQALRIARTETTSITNAARLMAGNSSQLLLEKKWVSVLDDRTRPDHYEMDGVRVGQDAPFIVNGEELFYPGDINPMLSAANIINCRCSVVLVPVRDKDGLPVLKGQPYTPAPAAVVVVPVTEETGSIVRVIGGANLKYDPKTYIDKIIKEYNLKGTIKADVDYGSTNSGGSSGWKFVNGKHVSSDKIDVYGQLNQSEFEAVVRHELKHVQQKQTGRLQIYGGIRYWDGEAVLTERNYATLMKRIQSPKSNADYKRAFLEYLKLPWETDAHRVGDAFGSLTDAGLKAAPKGTPTDLLPAVATNMIWVDPKYYTDLDKLILDL